MALCSTKAREQLYIFYRQFWFISEMMFGAEIVCGYKKHETEMFRAPVWTSHPLMIHFVAFWIMALCNDVSGGYTASIFTQKAT
jgi:hypothetical protein